MRRKLDILVLLVCAAVLAAWHVAQQRYTPVLGIASGTQIVHAALDPVDERRDCGAAARGFVARLRTDCPDCTVLFARCERALPGFAIHPQKVGTDPIRAGGARIKMGSDPIYSPTGIE